jgi:glycosyltransferase involved in cell wall biosynthesis
VRVMFVARAMHNMAGGVERMIVTIMNGLAARGHDISLFSWDKADARAFYEMAPQIHWYRLGMGDPAVKAGVGKRLARVAAVRRIAREAAPEVVVCFQGGPFKAMLAYLSGLGIPIVAAERTAPTLYEHAGTLQAKFIEQQAFRFACRITVQFDRYRNLYPAYLRDKIVTIPNPVFPAACRAAPATENERRRLLSVGRLAYQKNYPALLDAFALIAPRFPTWDLWIVGEGEDRAALEARVARSPSLAGRVHLPGATEDVNAAYCSAHLFCLPSRWEGFPNALAEALAHGLPAVGFLGCAGVPDLIEDGTTGFLAAGNGDAAELAKALAEAMASTGRLAAMGAAAARSVEKYGPDAILAQWERLLDACRRP